MMTEKRRKKCAKGVKSAAAVLMCATLALPVAGAASFHANAAPFDGVSEDGKYYTDYNTLEDAQAAAAELAVDIASEGMTLLKNKGAALPLDGGARVSVFGVGQDAPAGNATSNYGEMGTGILLTEALEAEGFRVNTSLRDYYGTIDTTFGAEQTEFDNGLKNSFGMYNDVAIVMISRGGGEGSDMPTVTDEDMNDTEENDGWTHLAPGGKGEGANKKAKKHFLQMTDSEVELFEYVKAQGFKKIVYVINSSEIFELKNLENDEAVDGILWIGRAGATGMTGAARILSGKVNPSGKTVDTWYSDFTADPTWYNAITNEQNGSGIKYAVGANADVVVGNGGSSGGFAGDSSAYFGVDYEEDIYVGYRYYETKAADMNAATSGSGDTWYDNAVVYPFGYGLSYTEFAYSDMEVTLGNGTKLTGGGTLDASLIASGAGKTGGGQATVKTMTVSVKVKNKGSVSGKETVEIYVKAPYINGQVEKSHVKLVGFAKTKLLKPGEEQVVNITVNVQDLASYDYTDANKNGFKGYEIDEGAYSLLALHNAHGWTETSAVKVDFTVANGTSAQDATALDMTKAAYLELDDYSGEKIENLFSKENGMYYSLRTNDGDYKFNATASDKQVLMSRANTAQAGQPSNAFTLPQAPTEGDRRMSEDMYKSLKYWDSFDVDSLIPDTVIADNSKSDSPVYYKDKQTIAGVVAEKDFVWTDEVDAADMSGWTQAASRAEGTKNSIQLSEMSGIDPYDTTTVITEGRFKDMTHAKAWETFMNSLTWDEVKSLVGQLQKRAYEPIGMNALSGQDSAWNFASTFNFTCNTILGATWNTELSRAKGALIGNMALLRGDNTWWGNSANTHRSPFGGRVFEYPSEDGILAGYISGNETLGAVSRGLTTYMKHCALNDQETNRNGLNLFAWVSEQAVREIYFKSFQIAAQEGQSTGVMGAFARMGRVSINDNYQFCTALFRDEWGCKTISHTTDNYNGMRNCSPVDLLIRAGTDNIDSSTNMSGTWDANLKLGAGDTTAKGGVKLPTDEDNAAVMSETAKIQWYTMRKQAMIFLWTHANSAMNKNGVDFSGWTAPELKATQGATLANNVTVAGAGIEGDKIEYVVINGSLPEGITLGADGTLSGKPTAKAGTYNFTVQARVDNWVVQNKQMSYVVTSGFEIDETEGKIGEEFYAVIESDNVTATAYPRGIVYSVKSGTLPKGLTLGASGEIEGTPTESGEFTFTVGVAATYQVRQGYSRVDVTDNYEYEVTLDIAASASSANDIEFRVNGGKLEYKTEGGDWTAVSSGTASVGGVSIEVGEKVNGVTTITITNADGTKQTVEVKDGVDGAKGDSGEGGCGSKVETTSAAVAAAVVLAGLGALLISRKKKQNA